MKEMFELSLKDDTPVVSKMADAVIEANQGVTEADGEIEAESEEFSEEAEEVTEE